MNFTSPRLIRRLGRSIRITPGHDSFWDDFESGRWEPDTLSILDHYVGPDTLYLDIGAWIGPTLLFAAPRAGHAAGFEPDPVAYTELAANLAANPLPNPIQLHRCAVAKQNGVVRMGSDTQPGDSMSSVLFADRAGGWTAPARRLDSFEADWPVLPHCFAKIDIEGGEFDVLPSMTPVLLRRRATVFLSLHQHFFLKPYLGRGFLSKLQGELRLLIRIIRFYPLLRAYPYIYDNEHRRLRPTDFLRRRHWRTTSTLLLSHGAPPWSAPSTGFSS
ncbi:MAG: FkbM family methyltransferase [Verrucomicrobia bacterium]|nr:FkbM family methyltransferase [Verrucomicrobiota bacterium]